MLTSVDVAYGADVTDIPATNSGNPKIGQFPVRIDASIPTPSTSIEIAGAWAPGQQLAVAVHANVVRVDEQGNVIERAGAWAGEIDFPGNSIASYFVDGIDECIMIDPHG